jgi:chromosome partitioning protein
VTRSIALANQKGGVGKTTTAINLGAAMAERGRDVLIVDLDPQANATASLGLRAHDGRGAYEFLLQSVALSEVIMRTSVERLWIVPSSPDLAGAEIELIDVPERESALKRALAGRASDYDFIFIDSPPSVGLLTVNALVAADEVIVPVQCEYLALEGLGEFTRTLDMLRRGLNRDLTIRGILLTMFDRRTNLSMEVAQEVRKHFPNTFRTIIPRSVRLSEAPSHGVPINVYDMRSSAAEAYGALADELLETRAGVVS